MAKTVEKLLEIALSQEGYLEKASNSQLDDKTANAGKGNYTKYWRDLLPSFQKQPWCQAFVNWCFTQAFGEISAKSLLCHGINNWSYYTPTCADFFKAKGQWYTTSSMPTAGDIIYFKNSARICHVGIVTEVKNGRVYTIEGNTSSKKNVVVANGGGVFLKDYKLDYSSIAGYGRPKYDPPTKYNVGWNQDLGGWWYADTEKTYLKNTWFDVESATHPGKFYRYYFEDKGYAVKGICTINDKKYYFKEDGDLACALCTTEEDGSLVEKVIKVV